MITRHDIRANASTQTPNRPLPCLPGQIPPSRHQIGLSRVCPAKSPPSRHRYSIRNDENGQRLTDSLQFVFMELAGFNKRLQDCNSFEDKFLYFFKNLFLNLP